MEAPRHYSRRSEGTLVFDPDAKDLRNEGPAGLRTSGHYSIAEIAFLIGSSELEARTELAASDISANVRPGEEAVAAADVRRLFGRLFLQSRRGAASRPGFSLPRLRALMNRSLTATGLDLSGLTVLTEAATGAYATTAVIAAMAGAERVHAVTKPNRHGTVAEAKQQTLALASAAGVADRITVMDAIGQDVLQSVDIVTNSGHLRPLTANIIDHLPDHAVIALMFEAWEFRQQDLDIDACFRRGIPVVGVNEHHPAVDVFSFLGPLCVRQLQDCGLAVYSNRIALVCDNGFSGPLFSGISSAGASVAQFENVESVHPGDWDAVVVALQPKAEARIGTAEAQHLAGRVPTRTAIVQFWGDMDRQALEANDLAVWPPSPPGLGHMGILLSEIGPEPIVRLQTGGLRAAEWVRRGGADTPGGFAQVLTPAT